MQTEKKHVNLSETPESTTGVVARHLRINWTCQFR